MSEKLWNSALKKWFRFEVLARQAEKVSKYESERAQEASTRFNEACDEYDKMSDEERLNFEKRLAHLKFVLYEARRNAGVEKENAKTARDRADAWKDAARSVAKF